MQQDLTDMATGMTCRLILRDRLLTQIFARKMIRSVNSEETLLTPWEGMDSESSTIWSQENSHANLSNTMLMCQVIHIGRIDLSLPILMTTPAGNAEEMEPLLRKLEISTSTTSKLPIIFLLESSSL